MSASRAVMSSYCIDRAHLGAVAAFLWRAQARCCDVACPSWVSCSALAGCCHRPRAALLRPSAVRRRSWVWAAASLHLNSNVTLLSHFAACWSSLRMMIMQRAHAQASPMSAASWHQQNCVSRHTCLPGLIGQRRVPGVLCAGHAWLLRLPALLPCLYTVMVAEC